MCSKSTAQSHERRVWIRRGGCELGIVVGHEAVAQIGVGGLDRGDARHAEFVDEPILQGAVEPLAAAAGLGGVGADVLDAEADEGPADMREPGAVDLAPAFGV